ncbi:MAG: hypothetical protein JSU81_04390 [Candidatus Coatesbacteria bacterium]|nr:MAG: hypothetical protein JSU81_04390 [Candidatus Coatesbacteria bacterium]
MAAVYLIFRSAYYFPDPMRWELAVAAEGFRAAWHKHHLLYTPLAAALHAALRPLGYTGGWYGAMQILDAAVGAAGFALAYSIFRRAAVTPPLALAGSFAAAFSFGYWSYACNAQYIILVTVGAMAAFWAVQRAAGGRGFGRWVAAAAAAGATVFAHVVNVLLLPFVVIAYFVLSGRRRWYEAAALAAAFLLPGAAGYVVVAFAGLGLAGPGEAWRWFFGVPGVSKYYLSFRLVNPLLDLYAFGRNVFGLRWLKDVVAAGWTPAYGLLAAATALGAAAVAVAFGGATRRFARRGVGRRSAWLAAALFAPYALFFTFREAGALDRWTVQVFAAVFFIYASTAVAPSSGRWFRALLYVLPVCFFAVNLWGSICPESKPENNEHLAYARFVEGLTEPGDLVINAGGGGFGPDVYVRYFTGAETAELGAAAEDDEAFRAYVDGKIAAGHGVFLTDARPVVVAGEAFGFGASPAAGEATALAADVLKPYGQEYVATYRGRRYRPSTFWRLYPRAELEARPRAEEGGHS